MGVGHKLYCTEENVLPTHSIGEMGLLTKGIQKKNDVRNITIWALIQYKDDILPV